MVTLCSFSSTCTGWLTTPYNSASNGSDAFAFLGTLHSCSHTYTHMHMIWNVIRNLKKWMSVNSFFGVLPTLGSSFSILLKNLFALLKNINNSWLVHSPIKVGWLKPNFIVLKRKCSVRGKCISPHLDTGRKTKMIFTQRLRTTKKNTMTQMMKVMQPSCFQKCKCVLCSHHLVIPSPPVARVLPTAGFLAKGSV